ncbi:BZ3500_MvSof-1268-A1-R1_Chr12-2g03801 [Microbotryum saponariae]|uniref:Defective in cullin neddylation protein n=1 Tax=Microbotryum saponariae TaxID=289078 RepID=A0A2X0KQC2_9BASI|nr:BZ3500_MvSof-1268-A1-R1_Chr12-2g03801 [Microbotryum saponariae]
MSSSKAARETRVREFIDITGASPQEAARFLKTTSYRLDAALEAFFNDPTAMRAAEQQRLSGGEGGTSIRNLDKLWDKYRDVEKPDEIHFEGTIRYCEDLGIAPEDIVMLAVAWLAKAPTMGHFSKKGWTDGWREAKCAATRSLANGARDVWKKTDVGPIPYPCRRDTIELQRSYIDRLRADLHKGDTFRKVYAFTFDYAKAEGQKSMQYEIAQELWKLLIPSDPAADFPTSHLDLWLEFLQTRGERPVSKDTWNLFLEFTRTIDPLFQEHDEEAAWPSVIDDFVDFARHSLACKDQPA